MIKLLLTDSGIKNPSIHAALLELLGKPIEECSALCIPTALYGHSHGSPEGSYRFISGRDPICPMVDLGWNSVGVLELTALPSIDRDRWMGWIERADVFLVNGGEAIYLAHWMRESGLADLLPTLHDKVWVGLSGGSLVMTQRIGSDFFGWKSPEGGDEALGIVPLSIYPHVGSPGCPDNTFENAEAWAKEIGNLAYAIDDQTAFKVVAGNVEIISEGTWKRYNG